MDWHFTPTAFGRLDQLVRVVAPSAFETAMSSFLSGEWSRKGLDVHTDVLGNLYGDCPGSGSKHVAVVAHLDSVLLQVTQILSNGMLQFRSVGMNPSLLLGQPVTLLGEGGLLQGVIGYDPTSQYSKGVTEEDLWIDIGVNSREGAARAVSVGDAVVFQPRLSRLGGRLLCGTSLDDRIGLFILDQVMDLLVGGKRPVHLHFVGTAQEEIALRGASVIGHHLPPLDACIILDVDYATDTPAGHANQMGALSLGQGVGLNVKSDNNPALLKRAHTLADELGIPCQLTVGRFPKGGTDASVIQLQQGGIATLNINIPCRYMHSPVELCDVNDVECAIRLISSLIASF